MITIRRTNNDEEDDEEEQIQRNNHTQNTIRGHKTPGGIFFSSFIGMSKLLMAKRAMTEYTELENAST